MDLPRLQFSDNRQLCNDLANRAAPVPNATENGARVGRNRACVVKVASTAKELHGRSGNFEAARKGNQCPASFKSYRRE